MGVPVVATNCPSGPREILKDGTIGRLVPVGDPDALAEEGMRLMEQHSIQGLLVIDEQDRLVGALNFQDLLKAGVV